MTLYSHFPWTSQFFRLRLSQPALSLPLPTAWTRFFSHIFLVRTTVSLRSIVYLGGSSSLFQNTLGVIHLGDTSFGTTHDQVAEMFILWFLPFFPKVCLPFFPKGCLLRNFLQFTFCSDFWWQRDDILFAFLMFVKFEFWTFLCSHAVIDFCNQLAGAFLRWILFRWRFLQR